MDKFIKLVQDGQYSFVAVREDTLFYTADGIGVKPIIAPMRENQQYFKDCFVVDTIIGRAAAHLLVLSQVAGVYGKVMSKTAIQVFERYNIPYQYETLVTYIENRTHTGMCPLEDSVKDENDPAKAFFLIEARIAQLMQKK